MVQKYDSRLLKIEALYGNSEFRALPIKERWAIRFSDGILITPEKLVETTAGKIEIKRNPEIYAEAEEWLKRHVEKGKAYKANNTESYAMTGQAVREWHEVNNIPLETKLIEKNLPARFYGGLIETEGFSQAPLKTVANLSFKTTPTIINPLSKALEGIGIVTTGRGGRIIVRAAAPEPAQTIIKEVLEEANLAPKIRVSYPAFRREATDLDPAFYAGIVQFYTMFAKSFLQPSHRETIDVYLGKGREEQDSYFAVLVAEAISKFNEASGAPLAGYIAATITSWVNDLPSHTLGDDLANFQRQRKQAVRELLEERGDNPGTRYSDEVLAEKMGLPLSEYLTHKEANENWVKTRTLEELVWKENGRERVTHNLDPAQDTERDPAISTALTLAILDAGINSKAPGLAEECLSALAAAEDGTPTLTELSNAPASYQLELATAFKKRINQIKQE